MGLICMDVSRVWEGFCHDFPYHKHLDVTCTARNCGGALSQKGSKTILVKPDWLGDQREMLQVFVSFLWVFGDVEVNDAGHFLLLGMRYCMSLFSPSYPGARDSDMNQIGAEYQPLADLQEGNTVSSQESSKDFDRQRRRATESQVGWRTETTRPEKNLLFCSVVL